MKELRCVLFSAPEVATAVVERRRRVKEALPVGTINKVTFELNSESCGTVLHLVGTDGIHHEIPMTDAEVASALVAYCLGRRVPLPAEGEKFLLVVNGHLALMVRVSLGAKTKG